jgi:hypothetical protein
MPEHDKNPPIPSKAAAQRRVDRIAGFNAELAELERAGVLALSAGQKAAVAAHHAALREGLGHEFDVDLSEGARRLSAGMQIVSFLGAAALAASVFFLFYQYWGYFATAAEVAILIAAPLITLAAAFYIRSKEATGYFAKLAALISFACFVLNLSMLGRIFNIAPSHNAFILWAAYAFLLAYALNVRLLLGAGILCVFAFIGAQTGTWSGMYWLSVGKRPENFLLPALLLFAVPSLIDHARYHAFEVVYRVLAMVGFFIVILVLANWGGGSYLHWNTGVIEGLYQTAGFLVSAAAVLWGVRRGLTHVMLTGNVFFALFLYTKFFDWWWGWMPKYLFFFLIGLTAILALVVFRRLRNAAQGAPA